MKMTAEIQNKLFDLFAKFFGQEICAVGNIKVSKKPNKTEKNFNMRFKYEKLVCKFKAYVLIMDMILPTNLKLDSINRKAQVSVSKRLHLSLCCRS